MCVACALLRRDAELIHRHSVKMIFHIFLVRLSCPSPELAPSDKFALTCSICRRLTRLCVGRQLHGYRAAATTQLCADRHAYNGKSRDQIKQMYFSLVCTNDISKRCGSSVHEPSFTLVLVLMTLRRRPRSTKSTLLTRPTKTLMRLTITTPGERPVTVRMCDAGSCYVCHTQEPR